MTYSKLSSGNDESRVKLKFRATAAAAAIAATVVAVAMEKSSLET